jgi:hypothetical protein
VVTTKGEGLHFYKILMDYMSPRVARMMLDDMDFEIADTTGNESIRESIKMVRKMLYDFADENKKDKIDLDYEQSVN